jgi:uncharacterized YigZ family protein
VDDIINLMIDRYPIPAKEARAEILVVNSRFIATAGPVFSVDQAKQFIARARTEFSDATHNVPAYMIGFGSSVTAHCSDDGEPSGTAGRPALAVLQGCGMGDIAVVVTRYFGGTKLGTGGLVRAYTDSVKEVLSILPRAEKISTHVVMAVFPYPYYQQIRRLVIEFSGIVIDEVFEADVTITARFGLKPFNKFQNALKELTRGTVEAIIIETERETIMPLGSFPDD